MKAKLTTPPPQNYWNKSGRFEKLYIKLQALIPSQGKVENHENNPCLDLFRRAANCYYDLFNNGLCNRSKEFYQIFGFSPLKLFPQAWGSISGIDFNEVMRDGRLDRHMDKLIYSAAIEQKLIKLPKTK